MSFTNPLDSSTHFATIQSADRSIVSKQTSCSRSFLGRQVNCPLAPRMQFHRICIKPHSHSHRCRPTSSQFSWNFNERRRIIIIAIIINYQHCVDSSFEKRNLIAHCGAVQQMIVCRIHKSTNASHFQYQQAISIDANDSARILQPRHSHHSLSFI